MLFLLHYNHIIDMISTKKGSKQIGAGSDDKEVVTDYIIQYCYHSNVMMSLVVRGIH